MFVSGEFGVGGALRPNLPSGTEGLGGSAVSWHTHCAMPQCTDYQRETADSFRCLGTGGNRVVRMLPDSLPTSYISHEEEAVWSHRCTKEQVGMGAFMSLGFQRAPKV